MFQTTNFQNGPKIRFFIVTKMIREKKTIIHQCGEIDKQ